MDNAAGRVFLFLQGPHGPFFRHLAADLSAVPAPLDHPQTTAYLNAQGRLVLDEAKAEGRINRGDTILMSGFGAGLTWGTALFRW